MRYLRHSTEISGFFFAVDPARVGSLPRLAGDGGAAANAGGPVLRGAGEGALGGVGRRLVAVTAAEGALGLDHGLDVGRLPHPAAPQLLDVRPRPLVEAEPRALLFGLAIEGSAGP